jgi:UDP-2,3-diacylglucosamine hydrolase
MPATDALPEIRCEAGMLVIADLHLDVASDDARETSFERWLGSLGDVPRLLILGDLFDSWIGPAQAELASARRVIGALRDLTRRGTRVDVLKGNRDFLLEARFEELTGATVHVGGLIATSETSRVLFIHGDELCTLDHGYQRLRRVLRSAPLTWIAPRVPRQVALAIARRLRRASVEAIAMKPAAEKEQQETEVLRLAAETNCDAVVCGHAHVFRDTRPQNGPRWIVLDAFGGAHDVLRWTQGGGLRAQASGAK